jgi:hypothetical protein
MAEELDLEEFWADIRPKPSVVVVSDRVSDLKGQLLIASEKAGFELAQKFRDYAGTALDTDLLAKIISEGVKVFMEKWFEGLRDRDLSGLIEIVLEGQRLTPTEMQGFVRALPDPLITKIVNSAIASGTGIHALMALEKYRRSGRQEYVVEVVSGQVQVRFTTPNNQEVVFNLYESFNLESAPDAVG